MRGSPFADLDRVRLALTTCPTRSKAAAFLGASVGGKTYHRLDALADDDGNATCRRPQPATEPTGVPQRGHHRATISAVS